MCGPITRLVYASFKRHFRWHFCTGGKAAQTLAEIVHTTLPKVGGYIETTFADRHLRFWRMPSSSRAYPLSLDKKAAAYQHLFSEIGIIK